MCTFIDFRDGPGGRFVADTFGLDITDIQDWGTFRAVMLDHRQDLGGAAAFVARVQRRYGTGSTGERALLLAVLFAIDYRWLADELARESGRSFLEDMENTSGEWARAAAACLAVGVGP